MKSHAHAAAHRMRTFARREDGMAGLMQVVTFLVLPVLAVIVLSATMMMMRVGGDLGASFERDAQLTQMVNRMQVQLSRATDMQVRDAHAFTTYDQPSRRNAYYSAPAGAVLPDVCTSDRWELVPAANGTLTLTHTQSQHTTDACDSPVQRSRTWELPGLAATTGFAFENAYGRDLHFNDGREDQTASANPRPAGLFDNEWLHPKPGLVSIGGQMNQLIGETPIAGAATTSLRQLRPGVVVDDLGELGPPVIARADRGGDLFAGEFTAVMNLTDPRVVVEWRWREAMNIADDETTGELPDGSWSAWSDWSSAAFSPDRTVKQGEKWHLEAQYRVTLEDQEAQSETVRLEWVRPIDQPALPTTTVTAIQPATVPTTGDLNAGYQAKITSAPAACPDGTRAEARYVAALGAAAMPTTYSAPIGAAPFEWTVDLPQRQRITAHAQARCVSDFYPFDSAAELAPQPVTAAEWGWVTPDNRTVTQPIQSRPTATVATSIASDTGVIDSTLDACPSGTTYQAQGGCRLNETGLYTNTTASYQDVTTTASFTATTVREGETIRSRVNARCKSPYTSGPIRTVTEADYKVNPIVTVPTVTGIDSQVSGTTGTGTADLSGCPAWLNYRGSYRQKVNEGAWTTTAQVALPAGVQSWTSAAAVGEGSSHQAGLVARCGNPSVTAVVGPTTTVDDETPAVSPIISVPTVVTTEIAYNSGQWIVRAEVGGCPTALSYQLQSSSVLNGAPAKLSTWAPWGSDSSVTIKSSPLADSADIGEGDNIRANLTAACASPYTQGPGVSGAELEHTVPITTAPNGVAEISMDAATGIASGRVTGITTCPAGTDPMWRVYDTQASAWTAWFPGSDTGWKPVAQVAYGDSAVVDGQAVCSTPYASSPVLDVQAGPASRPYPVPDAPASVSETAGGVTYDCTGQGFSTAFAWPAAANADTYSWYLTWRDESGTTRNTAIQSTSSTSATFTLTGDSVHQDHNVTAYVRSESAWGASSWTGSVLAAKPTGGCDMVAFSLNCPATTDVELPLTTEVGVAKWSDGVTSTTANTTRTVEASTPMTVTFKGTFTGMSSLAEGLTAAQNNCYRAVDAWSGDFDITNAFRGMSNLTDVPDELHHPVTTLASTFSNAKALNDDISGWDTSNVTNLNSTFQGASAFNQAIGSWNTSKVTSMTGTFWNASAFNQPLSAWDTGNVTDMSSMFYGTASFNQPLGTWNTSKVNTMSTMFSGATAFNQPVGTWNTAAVTNMSSMFSGATAFNQPIGNWNTSKVLSMGSMFFGASSFDQPLRTDDNGTPTNTADDKWNVSAVTSMSQMFYNAIKFNGDITNWDTRANTSMLSMFSGASKFNQPIGNWNKANVNNMTGTFRTASSFNQPLNWDTAKVAAMSGMFYAAVSFNQPLTSFNTGNVANMASMFQGAMVFSQDLSWWNVAKVTTATNRANFALSSGFQNNTALHPVWP